MNTYSNTMGKTDILRTPLCQTHIHLGARMIEFHGGEMPVEYSGTMKEHKAIRESAGLFDVCHMNKLKVKGIFPMHPLENWNDPPPKFTENS